MNLIKSWSAKEISDFVDENRNTFSKLYKGEKYLLKKYISNNQSILDIGCAQGNLFSILKKKHKKLEYIGIDTNLEMIKLAKKKFPDGKFYNYKNLKYSNYFKKKFDIVIIFGTLHVNSNWKKMLLEAYKVSSKYVLFDLRLKISNKQKTKNMLDLNLNKNKKKLLIPYYLLETRKLNIFFKKKFPTASLDIYSYEGKPSIYSDIRKNILFSNYALIKK